MQKAGWCVLIALLGIVGAVMAAEITSPNSTGINLPDWVWAGILTGAVSGAVTYGAIRVKLAFLFSQLTALEKKQYEENLAIHTRLNEFLREGFHRRNTDPQPPREG